MSDEALRLKAENERLRGIIRNVVAHGGRAADEYTRRDYACRLCGTPGDPFDSKDHGRECPWPSLVAEAEKS